MIIRAISISSSSATSVSSCLGFCYGRSTLVPKSCLTFPNHSHPPPLSYPRKNRILTGHLRGVYNTSGSNRLNVLSSSPSSSTFSSLSNGGGSSSGSSGGGFMVVMVKSLGIGTLAGMCGSLAGMGGGFVMIPLMTSPAVLRLSQHQAHGTSLFAVAATGMAGAIGYANASTTTTTTNPLEDSHRPIVDMSSAMAITLCGMITARFGAMATNRLSASMLQRTLGIFMLLIAPIVPAKQYLIEYSQSKNNKEMNQNKNDETNTNTPVSTSNPVVPVDMADTMRHATDKENSSMSSQTQQEQPSSTLALWSSLFSSPLTTQHYNHYWALIVPQWNDRVIPSAAIGICSGFMAGLLGVGGGSIVVPALTVLTDMTHYQALATSLCAMTLPAVAGTWTHYRHGNVALRVAPALAVGAMIGGYAGGQLGSQIHETTLRWGFSGLMVCLGIRTLLK